MKNSTRIHHYQVVEQALAYLLDCQSQQPSLAEIAKHCAMSEHHFQRIFSQWAGVSPKQFLQSLNKNQAKSRLLDGASLLKTSTELGFSSSSRLHDLFVTMEAVTPGDIKNAGDGIEFKWGIHPSPFGQFFIAITHRGLHRLDFIMDNNEQSLLSELQQQWPKAQFQQQQALTKTWSDKIFSKSNNPENIHLWLSGSQFQFNVWEALLRIPEGSLCSYGDIAKAISQPTAARAVGTAIGRNTIAFLIPCHRVIQSMGETGNYRWGRTRKQAIIGWEAS